MEGFCPLSSDLAHKNPWSPLPRDPRFSRETPDQLRARILASAPIVVGAVWPTDILHAKARKCVK